MVKIRQQIMFDEKVYLQLCRLRDETKAKNISQAVNWYFNFAAEEIDKKDAQLIRYEYAIDELKEKVK